MNWNIPKHVAKFKFTPLVPKSKTILVEVSPPGEESKPFFRALCTPISFLPSFPFSSKLMPADMNTITHPPLPGSPSSYSEVLTDKWISIVMTMKGRGELAKFKLAQTEEDIEKGEFGDGVMFPKIKPWGLMLHL